MTQIVGNFNSLYLAIALRDGEVCIHMQIQRQYGLNLPGIQAKRPDRRFWQHGDFVARHVNGG